MARPVIARPSLFALLVAVAFGALAAAALVGVLAYRAALGAPQTLARQTEQISAALERQARVAVSRADGPVLYVVGFRTCPSCIAFKASEGPWLKASGVQVRTVMFAPRETASVEEEAAAAELALTGSQRFLDAWTASPNPAGFYAATSLPPATSTPERAAALEANRKAVESLERALAANGRALAYPALFWRKEGAWRVMIGYSPEKAAAVRADLGVP
jgi:hypothetical protein